MDLCSVRRILSCSVILCASKANHSAEVGALSGVIPLHDEPFKCFDATMLEVLRFRFPLAMPFGAAISRTL